MFDSPALAPSFSICKPWVTGKAARGASCSALGNPSLGELGFSGKCGEGSWAEKQRPRGRCRTDHLALTRAASGHPGTVGSMEICCIREKGLRPGWTYPERDLAKEEGRERGEGRSDSVGQTLEVCASLSCWRYRRGCGGNVCC